MSEQAVTLTTDHRGVATLTLNRVDKHNAFDDEIISKLTDTLEAFAHDDNVRVVILAANGKSFSAGADLNWMKKMATYDYEENLHDATALAVMLNTLHKLPKPTIARVHGAAFGGGVGLVSCCDIAVATQRASFCLSEVKLGLVPATISPYVIAAIGERAAKRYFTTAERFNAETALRIGLVSEITTDDELGPCIERLVTALLTNGPSAISAAKQLIDDVGKRDIDSQLVEHTSKVIAHIRSSDEAKEGLSAFLEKRSASWVKTHS